MPSDEEAVTVYSLAQFIRVCAWIVEQKQYMYVKYPGAFKGAMLVDMQTANVVHTVWKIAKFRVKRGLLRKLKDRPIALTNFCWKVAS